MLDVLAYMVLSNTDLQVQMMEQNPFLQQSSVWMARMSQAHEPRSHSGIDSEGLIGYHAAGSAS